MTGDARAQLLFLLPCSLDIDAIKKVFYMLRTLFRKTDDLSWKHHCGFERDGLL
jgi:hypothetical protein